MSDAPMIRVMLVDDHDVVRRGLGVFLRAFSDMELVAEAANGEDAVQLCANAKPDVILMDILMPRMDGIAATRHIKTAQPEVKIIILTSSKEDEMVKTALQAGATGYVLKSVTFEELERAIRNAVAGLRYLDPEATEALVRTATQPPLPDYMLTTREQEVLTLLVKGMSNPQIAERLTVSLSTVKFHISSILTKLGVTSRTEAVALALEKKLVK
ncbi:MAG TPA: response regulator transcription factor [Aggregatilineales bacterium]|nr:response regulator transcription factor [Anaerolineales bacterium]HRE47593.1 response regulator transcription factor [Aggregatilineales bacterium]